VATWAGLTVLPFRFNNTTLHL